MSSFVLSGCNRSLSATAGAEELRELAHGPPIDFLHINAVQAICSVLIDFGIDPNRLFEQDGISTLFLDGTEVISFASLGRLTALGAHCSQCPHFGLLVGQRTTLASLGLLGVLMRNSETIGDALRALEAHHGLMNRGAVVGVSIDSTLAIVSYSLYQPDAEGVALHCERALAAMTNVLRAFCGADWAPDEVLLPRSQPPDTTPYRDFFHAHIRFEEEIAALVFPARLLKHPIEGANPVARKVVERRIQQLEAVIPADVTDELRRRLRATMTQKPLSAQQVARMMAIHRRTLSRRLKSEGTSFRLVANETRLGIAKQLLADTTLSLAQISATLEFSEPAAFTHAFRRWTGTTPSAWRKENQAQEKS
ncbi:AraC family transcriptional regulator [Methylobacterium nodulans]|uniref:Transcriptional regulator, AraC family n=1 Tax=Methylobacterium nodulans (strain LMG 21967 / CNCM I-2342 / ORS 2060) TaxID=460265 RepID=B8IH36_METNO|nr:AraC family transcriptional regulator [Methylobacterium nodulans]ACL59728.1 transcriptional regulator, AraC family [Methylobacterium nodulans ORS 2060]